MSATLNEETKQLMEVNRQLAPIMAKWFQAYLECSDAVQEVVTDMFAIISDTEVDADDREMAIMTLLEALFPSSHNGSLGGDLEELDTANREYCPNFAAVSSEMDQEEATFGDRVQKLLSEKNMTQSDLAKAIGVNQSAISMLLNRGARPQRRTVARIAEALRVSPESLWPM